MTLLSMTLLDQHRLDQAEALANEVAAVTRDQPEYREFLLAAQRILSCVLYERGDVETAEQNLRALIPQIDAELGPLHMEAYSARMALAQSLRRQAAGDEVSPARPALLAKEEAVLRETVRLQQARFSDAYAYPLLASQMKLVELLIEMRAFAEAQQIVEDLAPRVKERFSTAHWMYGSAMLALASINSAQGDATAAADAYEQALNAWRQMHGPSHPNVIGAMRDFLPYLDDAGRVDEGLQFAQELSRQIPPDMGGHGLLPLEIQAWIARFLSRKGMLDDADRIFASLEEHAAELSNDPVGPTIMLFRAGHLARRGLFDEADQELRSLCELQGGIGAGVNRAHPDDIAQMFEEVYTLWGRHDKAREFHDIASAIREGRAFDVDLNE